MYTTLQTQRPDGVTGDGRGHLLPLAYLLRICLLCKGQSNTVDWLLLREVKHCYSTHTKRWQQMFGISPVAGIWQDDTPTVCRQTASFPSVILCTTFHTHSWHAVDVCVILCWAPCPLPASYSTVELFFVNQVYYTKLFYHIFPLAGN